MLHVQETGPAACCLRQDLKFESDSACLALDDVKTSVAARGYAGTSAVEPFVAESAVDLGAGAVAAVGYSTSNKGQYCRESEENGSIHLRNEHLLHLLLQRQTQKTRDHLRHVLQERMIRRLQYVQKLLLLLLQMHIRHRSTSTTSRVTASSTHRTTSRRTSHPRI